MIPVLNRGIIGTAMYRTGRSIPHRSFFGLQFSMLRPPYRFGRSGLWNMVPVLYFPMTNLICLDRGISMLTSHEIWGSHKPAADGAPQSITIGDLHLWYFFRDDEFWIGHRYTSEMDGDAGEEPPEDLEWSRWAVKGADRELHISPVFPDLPVIVSSEYLLRIIPETEIRIYTRIPIWIRFETGKSKHLLTEMPSVPLSKTWFGTPVEGELCYWSTTKARRSLSDVQAKPHVVNCPIRISNRSAEDLNFDKFCFRVERLKIFKAEDQLWADETDIKYHGEELNSDITMTGRIPKEIEGGKMLNGPRKQIQKSLATRTFRRIFDDNPLFGR